MADINNMSQDELNARNKALKAHNKLVDDALKLVQQEAKYRQEVGTSIEGYLKGLEESNQLKKTINNTTKTQAKFEEELRVLQEESGELDEVAIKAAKAKLDAIKKQNKLLKDQQELLDNALATVNKTKMIGAKVGAEAVKGFGKVIANLPNMVTGAFGKIKDLGLFDMDKSIKQSALSMGLLSKQTGAYRSTIVNAAKQTAGIGVTIDDLTTMQATFSDELGRTVLFSEEAAVSIAKMSKDLGLSAEEAGRITAGFQEQGLSIESTGEFINDAFLKTHKMGLNANKVMKNITGNMKLLNRYNFKDGVAGLTKMAQTVSKLGVSMEFAAGMADKLWDVEGAVDMSAQLQVMGGEWAKLADPFQLMYKARNDIQGLTEDLGKAAAASAHLNKKGEIEISAMEMHRLKIVAEQTGIAYDELATAAKNAYKLTKIKSQVNFAMTDEEKEFISNQAELNKDGKATITINGHPKLLSQLTKMDRANLDTQMKEKALAGERAKQALTFDESLTNLINQMKIYLLPIVDSINKDLLPKLQKFSDDFEKNGWGDKIAKFAQVVGDLVTSIGSFIIENPIKTAMLYFGTKLVGFLFDKVTWFTNGMLLAKGFNATAGLGGASSGGKGGGLGSMLGKRGKGVGMGAIAGLAGGAVDMANSAGVFGEEGSTGHKVAGMGASALEWGGTGAMIGSLIAPGIGTAIGAAVGGLAGAIKGGYDEGVFGTPTHDGIFESYKKGLGSDFSKGRGIIQGGKIHPIDNKDDLMAMKPGGPVANAMGSNQQTVNRIEFSDITINGEIRLVSPGSPGLSIDLLKDQGFRRDITRTIQVELEKNKVGGKNRG